MVRVSRFRGSRLASGPSPSPYQQMDMGNDNAGKFSWGSDGKRAPARPSKVPRLSSGASIGAAIVEAEDSLETDVCFPTPGETL